MNTKSRSSMQEGRKEVKEEKKTNDVVDSERDRRTHWRIALENHSLAPVFICLFGV